MATTERNRSRLGRGLSSLISSSSEADALPVMRTLPAEPHPAPTAEMLPQPTDGQLVSEIPVADVKPNPHQPRREINPATIAELATSLKSAGLIQPIIVRQTGHGFELIAGERRWRAAQLAGMKTLPAIVRHANPANQAQMALIENIQREDLNAMDRALSYRTMMDQQGLTQAELAEKLGEDRSSIANHLRLLQLTEPVRVHVRTGTLSLGHAKLLAGIEDVLEQQRLADLCVENDLSVRNLERMIQSPASPPPRAPVTPSAHVKDLETRLTQQLGMRVSVKSAGKKGAGKLVIHYTGLDQFDGLIERLGLNLNEL